MPPKKAKAGEPAPLIPAPATKETPAPPPQVPVPTPSKKAKSAVDFFLITDEDVLFEQDIQRDKEPQLKTWLQYINHKKKNGKLAELVFVFERAVKEMPRSYKLWKMYLDIRVSHVEGLNPSKYAAEYDKVNDCYERSIVLLNKMPRIWTDYLSFLLKQCKVTHTRRTFDRALRALPITQHNRIWELYIPFANSASGETAIKIWRRYMQGHPEEAEEFIELLVELGYYTEAAQKYIDILNNPKFRSKAGKSNFQLWMDLCELLEHHARDIKGLPVEDIIRSGIHRFEDQRGKLWTCLANYWTNVGDFDRARDIYEEGITTVMTVRDFTQIFDTYVEFEETIISQDMEDATERQTAGKVDAEADEELDRKMMRFEYLMDRRPFLVNDVLLRQNPNNVMEWEKRVALWGDNKKEVVQTYTDAIAAIQPKKAVGKFSDLWTKYGKFYEEGGDLKTARVIMEKAVKVPFKTVQELAEMWVEWAEMELRNENFDQAMDIMAKSTVHPKNSKVDYFDETLTPQQRVHKSWKLWSFYVDLVESVGTLNDTKEIYEKIFELKIATPQTVVNYANLLEESKYFEESFKVYERGLDLFTYPTAFEIWNLYLKKAMDRKINLERLRDLFEQSLENCPPKFAKVLYIMYGQLEEERGLARHAMRIYERATRAVSDEDRFEMYEMYILKSASNFGLTSTRPIYERAIEVLPDSEAKNMCLKFAEMERRLGEIDRARAIYGHASQFCDPRVAPEFWTQWEKFEIQHGNEDTFKEMLRIKRSVQAQYNTDVNFIAAQAVARGKEAKAGAPLDETDGNAANGTRDAMQALDRELRAPMGFVAAKSGGVVGGQGAPKEQATLQVAANPDAIDIDMDD
ncbi:pre-mRNA-splicing factor syf1 [Orbilia ellipsospora]|uniref:Pre-mRNA-splicing factor SYF1 n=1 Tax=Orbilia ellipsospora TaxID=2528407 RepID=A0AAV9X1L6_9PEZI